VNSCINNEKGNIEFGSLVFFEFKTLEYLEEFGVHESCFKPMGYVNNCEYI